MRSHRSRQALVPLLLLAALLAGCATSKVQSVSREAVPVTVATVVQKTVPVEVRVIGNVEAYSTVSVKSQVHGQLVRVFFKEGQDVKKDEMLFEIDPRPFQESLKQAEAALARDTAAAKQAEANLARDKFQESNAQLQARRYGDLVKQGIVAQEQYDKLRTDADALQAAVLADQAAIENTHAAVRADQAAIENAKLQLAYCSLRSPLNGRTGSLLVYGGNVVKENDTVLVTINQINPIYVNFAVSEQYLAEIKGYMAAGPLQVQVLIPHDENRPEEGALTFVDNAVDRATGTIRLKGTFANRQRRLWPGQFVNVVLTLTALPNAVVAPSQAIQTGQQGQYVFVVKPDLTVESRPVTPGRTVGGETVIEKGLRPGEQVVTDGQLRLVPGALVQIKVLSS